MLMNLTREQLPGIKFTNILQTAFMYPSVLHCFSVLIVCVCKFFGKMKSADRKMLVKSTRERLPGGGNCFLKIKVKMPEQSETTSKWPRDLKMRKGENRFFGSKIHYFFVFSNDVNRRQSYKSNFVFKKIQLVFFYWH